MMSSKSKMAAIYDKEIKKIKFINDLYSIVNSIFFSSTKQYPRAINIILRHARALYSSNRKPQKVFVYYTVTSHGNEQVNQSRYLSRLHHRYLTQYHHIHYHLH